jgi:hypothetical protein
MGGINLQGSQYEKIAKDTKRRSQEPESRSQEVRGDPAQVPIKSNQ